MVTQAQSIKAGLRLAKQQFLLTSDTCDVHLDVSPDFWKVLIMILWRVNINQPHRWGKRKDNE